MSIALVLNRLGLKNTLAINLNVERHILYKGGWNVVF
jgi:hypothetical protein